MDVSQYLDIFIDESSEHIQTLSDCIMTLEQEPENKDTINEIFRAAHSLRVWQVQWALSACSTLHMIWKMYFRRSEAIKLKLTAQ